MFRARVFLPSGLLISVIDFTDVISNDTEVIFKNAQTKTATSFVLRNILYYQVICLDKEEVKK